jgi:hypothetical protein
MKRVSIFLVILLVSVVRGGVAQGPRLYDTFSTQFLDPAKWTGRGICKNWLTLDCARELQLRRLRLAVRTYGARDSNEGIQYDTSYVDFKDPAAITSISTRLVVWNAQEVPCSNNPELSHSQAILKGSFFNTGTSSVENDVRAFLVVERFSPAWQAENELLVHGFLWTAGEFFGWADLGSVMVGEEITISLRWDQPNHRFVAALKKPGGPPAVVFMPYSHPEAAPPVNPSKQIGVYSFAANCTDQRAVAGITAHFDDVMVNASPLP